MSLDATGGLIDDKYEIIRRLATGGMGDVYLVRHRHLQERRVVKVLRADLARDESASARFQQEARIATQIKHPNVAILYDYSKLADGRFYMVWEYIDGRDLGARLRESGPLPPRLAVEIAIQALRGLDAVHGAGVIHRDVSPDNLMLSEDRHGRKLVKIIDLGLVKDLRPDRAVELTQAGTFMGKFQYCSPEQAGSLAEGELDHRSDLYSLAQVLYEMLTGLPPFESESQHGFVLKRLTEPPIPLVRRNPEAELPEILEPIVMRGLERDREARYPDASAFIQALAEVVDVLDPRAPKPSARPRKARRAELSKEEKTALLARIDQASTKVERASRLFAEAEAALNAGRFEEARELVARLREKKPHHQGLDRLEHRIGEAESIARRRQQVFQAEQMLEKYLLERQQTLANLALETLLDLYPNHPKRDDYVAWVGLLADEAAQQEKAEKAFAAGRAAVARGDLEEAKKRLEEVEAHDLSGKLAGTLLSEVNAAERGRERSAEVEERKARLEEFLSEGAVDEARDELESLSSLEVTRVTVDLYRSQIEEAETRRTREVVSAEFERRYREAVAAHDWLAAREAALELEAALPDSPRPRRMVAEVSRLQEVEQRQEAIEQGLATFETYLEAGDLPQAEMALRVLRQLGGDHPGVVEAGHRLDRLRSGS